jgi:MFS family permease
VPHVKEKVPLLGILLGFELHFMQQFSGIKMNVTETSVIFAPYNASLSIYAPLIANIVQFAGSFLSIPVLSYYGRRVSIIGGNFILSIVNLITAVMFVINFKTGNEAVVNVAFALINVFMLGYAASIGSVVWVYVTELMPSRWVPFASSMNWLSAAISVIVAPYVLDAVGSPYPVFFFFGGILLVFYAINQRYLIETKGLTHDQVVAKLY